MAHHASKFVKCPFYHNHDSNRIVCEGLSENSTINLIYVTQLDRSRYMKATCNSIEGCRKCPIHNVLSKKWEDDRL